MNKGPDAYRTIGEASVEVGVEPYVIRFWETKFSQLRPVKRSGGRRFCLLYTSPSPRDDT